MKRCGRCWSHSAFCLLSSRWVPDTMAILSPSHLNLLSTSTLTPGSSGPSSRLSSWLQCWTLRIWNVLTVLKITPKMEYFSINPARCVYGKFLTKWRDIETYCVHRVGDLLWRCLSYQGDLQIKHDLRQKSVRVL
jgi:hypothetical protein